MNAGAGRRRAARGWLAAVVLLHACTGPGPALRPARCPAAPATHTEIAGWAPLRARVHLEAGRRAVALEVVARRQDRSMVIVGLAPGGTRLFALRQPSGAVEVAAGAGFFERAATETLAFFVFDALWRGVWIVGKPGPAALREATWRWKGEEVTETRREGRQRRAFRRGGDPSAGVVVDYREHGAAPAAAGYEIRNDWCGYDASVVPWPEEGVP